MTVEFVGVGFGLAFILLSLMFLVIVERVETRMLMIESQVTLQSFERIAIFLACILSRYVFVCSFRSHSLLLASWFHPARYVLGCLFSSTCKSQILILQYHLF